LIYILFLFIDEVILNMPSIAKIVLFYDLTEEPLYLRLLLVLSIHLRKPYQLYNSYVLSCITQAV